VPEVGPEIETVRGETGALIVMVKLSLAVFPVTSVTVTLTVYVPGELHDLVTEEPVAPLFQLYV
jgi:hypothetical protein